MECANHVPNLENQFLPPQGWKTDHFTNPETGHNIRYAHLEPETAAKGIIITLPGLSEFCEKYIETARFFSGHGYAFYVLDWAYQGCSSRYKKNRFKRHSDGYDSDLSDLHFLINLVPKDIPLLMLGHSMGGNIGLRYLSKHPSTFKAASFSAPMLGILDLRNLSTLVLGLLKTLFFLQDKYVPGGKDWHETARSSDGRDIFSSDPLRDQVHNAWCLANPDLQVGNATLAWVLESLKSINILKKPNTLKEINIPVLLSIAGQEKLVDNAAIKKAAHNLPLGRVMELKDAKHEIMMETDDIRDNFLEETLQLFTKSV
jgi:lysophospholipase